MSPASVPVAVVRDAAPLFAALGDETRLRLVARLSASGPESIARLAAHADVTRQAVTKHLEVLAAAGVVSGRRQGRERTWTLQPRRLEDAHAFLSRISREWDNALGRLARMVEET
jgi:DNA-binding transcriptional ArsR family regulator